MRRENIKVLSLFDGISGCQQALKNLDVEYEYHASEVDKYAIEITQKNFPDTKQLGDVKDIEVWSPLGESKILVSGKYPDRKMFKFDDIDLLCGGSPCQDLSITNKNRKGLDGERSGLFYEYVRILKEVKPKFFILENVASMSENSKKSISEKLFDIEPVMINSSLLTAQQRKRFYWVGELWKDGETYKKVEIQQPEDMNILLKDIWVGGVDCTSRIKSKKEGTLSYKKAYGSLKTLNQKSNCLTTGGQCISNSGATNVIIDDKFYIPNLETCELLQGFPINYTYDAKISNTQRYKMLGNSFTVPVIEHLIKRLFLKYE